MIENIVNITFVVSPVSLYSSEVHVLYSTGCRVHHLNMITSYKLNWVLGRVRSDPSELAVLTRANYFQDDNAGEAVICRQSGLSSVRWWGGWLGRQTTLVSAGSPSASPPNILSRSHQTRPNTRQLHCLHYLPPSL